MSFDFGFQRTANILYTVWVLKGNNVLADAACSYISNETRF